MRQLIVAFERPSNCDRLREILESTGEFSCLVCRSAAQVKRAVHKLRLDQVVCGFKLADESCEALYGDLPQRCAMLMVAPQAQLDLCTAAGIFKLPAPVRRSELLASVRLLAQVARSASSQMAHSASSQGHPPARRSQEERELVERAKQVLMARSGMTEDQAHRFLQKRSMDNGARLADTARRVLEGNMIGQ